MHSWLSKSGAVVGVVLDDMGGVLGRKVEIGQSNPRLAISDFWQMKICLGDHEFPTLAEQFKIEGQLKPFPLVATWRES